MLARRHLLGLIALAALAMAVVILCVPALSRYQMVGATGARIGAVLGVLWLAWPDLHRLPPWAWLVLPLGLLALFFAKPLLIYLAPALAAALAMYLFYRKVWRSPR